MVRIIETNLSLNSAYEVVDHQSRVIEVESWNNYINEIKVAKTVIRPSCIGSMHGATIPHQSKVDDLTYDDFHLSATINRQGHITKKLAYLVDKN